MKKYLAIILIVFIFSITGCSKTNSNVKNYLNTGTAIDSEAKDIMPNLDELPKYQNIIYKYTHKSTIIFESDSVALIVNYDDKTYDSEKDKIDGRYVFLDHKVKFDHEDKYIIPENEFSINSYTFKVIDKYENNKAQFPKSFGMIGTSDEKKSIAYLYFYDADLDVIGGKDDEAPMANFVKEYFKYDF